MMKIKRPNYRLLLPLLVSIFLGGCSSSKVTGFAGAVAAIISGDSSVFFPGNFSITSAVVGNGSVRLSWAASSGATSYSIAYGTSSQYYPTIVATQATSPFTVAGLNNGSTYYFMVTSYGGGGSTRANAEMVVVPGVPSAPTNVAITPALSGQVTLTWTGSAGVGSYNVKRSTVASGPYTTVSNSGSVVTTSYQDFGLVPGTTYYYVVTGVNPAGESANSVEVNITYGGPAIAVPQNQMFPIFSSYPPAFQGSTIRLVSTASDANNGVSINFTGCTYVTVGLPSTDSNYVATDTNCTSLPSIATINSSSVLSTASFQDTTGSGGANGINATRTLIWTPTSLQRGTYKFTVTASNGTYSSSANFYVVVAETYASTNLVASLDATFSHDSTDFVGQPMGPRSSSLSNNDYTNWLSGGGSTGFGILTGMVSANPWTGTGVSGVGSNPYALNINGANKDYLSLGTLLGGTKKVAVSMWINPSSPATANSVILSNLGAGGAGITIRQYAAATSYLEFCVNGCTNSCSTNGVPIPDLKMVAGSWTHVFATVDGTAPGVTPNVNNTKFYVNGRFVCSVSSQNLTNSDSVTNLVVGADPVNTNSANWSGSIADLKVYATASTSSGVGDASAAKLNFDNSANRFRVTPLENIVTRSLLASYDPANANLALRSYSSACPTGSTPLLDLTNNKYDGILRNQANSAQFDCSSTGAGDGYQTVATASTSAPNQTVLVMNPNKQTTNAGNYVQLPAQVVTSSTDFTFTGWVFWKGVNAWERIIDLGNDQGNYIFITPAQNTNTGAIRMEMKVGGVGVTPQGVNGSVAFPSNSWHHVATTVNASTKVAVLYVDGVAVGTTTNFTFSPANTGGNASYVGRSQFTDSYFRGYMGPMQFYNRALTAGEVKQNCIAHERRFYANPTAPAVSTVCAAP